MNNLGILMQAMRNPQAFLQQAMQSNNPIVQNAIQMYQKGDKEGINEIAKNLCKEKGTSFDEMAKQIKSQFGM
jgi:polyhydroxyalkanoate synthesis regulator protein